MINCTLDQVGKKSPADGAGNRFNQQSKDFPSMAEALEWLERDYGISKPKRIHEGNSIYRDTAEGGAELVGFMNRRWVPNYDRDPKAPRNYWEENWVSFSMYVKQPLDIKEALEAFAA